jgi:UDP-N-acetyl-D-mannosaminuronic acid dehydrogenase
MSSVRSTPVSLYDSDSSASELQSAFTGGAVPVAVYGLGKMGLPLASVYADVTGNVTGVDIDTRTVARINAGTCPVDGEPGLPELVRSLVRDGALTATTDSTRAASEATVHVVIVPTLIDDGEPDLSALEAAVRGIGTGLDRGDLVVVESTVPPRTVATG